MRRYKRKCFNFTLWLLHDIFSFAAALFSLLFSVYFTACLRCEYRVSLYFHVVIFMLQRESEYESCHLPGHPPPPLRGPQRQKEEAKKREFIQAGAVKMFPCIGWCLFSS